MRATIHDEITKIHEYIRKMALGDDLLRQQKHNEEKEEPSWKDNLYGMYHRETDGVVAHIKRTHQSLEKTGLKDSIAALIIAAQESRC